MHSSPPRCHSSCCEACRKDARGTGGGEGAKTQLKHSWRSTCRSPEFVFNIPPGPCGRMPHAMVAHSFGQPPHSCLTSHGYVQPRSCPYCLRPAASHLSDVDRMRCRWRVHADRHGQQRGRAARGVGGRLIRHPRPAVRLPPGLLGQPHGRCWRRPRRHAAAKSLETGDSGRGRCALGTCIGCLWSWHGWWVAGSSCRSCAFVMCSCLRGQPAHASNWAHSLHEARVYGVYGDCMM